MTKEDALFFLARFRTKGINEKLYDALGVAIEALNAQPSAADTNVVTTDTISRQAAIDALADYIHNVDRVYSTGKLTHDDCMDAAHSVLDKLPSAQQWIPLTVKYPETNEDVLLQFPSNQGVGFYENGSWGINTGDGIYSAIGDGEEMPMAWMPLPTPYREGKEQ